MRNIYSFVSILVVLPLVTIFFYWYEIGSDLDKVFLSISTFLFSIFTGFFISRQASRFNRVRETVTRFDGLMTSIYRSSGHISKELQEAVGEVLVAHYEKIFATNKWHIHFTQKSTTMASIHNLLDEHVKEDEVTKLSNQAIGAIVKSLAAAQDVRKQMVALYKERVPAEQWVLILFFAAMLVGTASIIPSAGFWFLSVVKGAFVVSVLSVLFILYRLNNLAFTEKLMGEESAHDVVGIIQGGK